MTTTSYSKLASCNVLKYHNICVCRSTYEVLQAPPAVSTAHGACRSVAGEVSQWQFEAGERPSGATTFKVALDAVTAAVFVCNETPRIWVCLVKAPASVGVGHTLPERQRGGRWRQSSCCGAEAASAVCNAEQAAVMMGQCQWASRTALRRQPPWAGG